MGNVYDIVIIGGGMAGLSAAAELAADHKVCVLEAESAPGYHSTGRSAATFVPSYGPAEIRALARASEPFFLDPPLDMWGGNLLSPRDEVMLIGRGEEPHIAEAEALGMQRLELSQLQQRVSLLKTASLSAALIDSQARDIDVDLMLQGFVKLLKSRRGELKSGKRVTRFTRHYGAWQVHAGEEQFSCGVIVNAAGAWAGMVADMAGACPVQITPKRRSAMLLDLSGFADVDNWPLCFGAGETFYFKPMGGKLMLSPADATPVEPHDAWADDMALAEAVEKFQHVIDFEVTHAGPTWGGLRCFADDGVPVAGYDDRADNFFWLAGQGGYGIQTAPALAILAAGLIGSGEVPESIAATGLDVSRLSPARFAS